MKSNILIIAPHPDDEILGCGGTIKKFSSGNNIWVLIISRGKPELYSDKRIENVRREALNAHELLGVAETRFFDFPAPELDMISVSELSAAINNIINEFKAGIIYLPHHGDIHHDHKAVFNAGLVAARPVKNCPVKQIYSYETLSETEWAAPNSSEVFLPTRYVDISEEFAFKIEAMKCFTTQLREFPNPTGVVLLDLLMLKHL
jgi:LmbE family N-acetylglucosaminyl deacetylase